MCWQRIGLWSIGLCMIASLGAAHADSRQDEVDNEIATPEFYAPEDTLRAYVSEALDKNPAIQETLGRYRASLERVDQVDTLPDPVFTFVQAIRSVETRVGPQINTFSFSQRFPWFGNLDLKGQVVMQEALAEHQMYRARQQDVIARTKRAYYELAYIDAAIGITREEQSLLEHYEALAQTRYATGQGLQQSVIKLQAEITRVVNRLEILGQQRHSVEARLNTLVDHAPERPIPAIAQPRLPDVEIDLEELYALGLDNRHELKATEERMRKSEKAIELAERDGWPDFFVGVGYINVGDRSDAAGIAMPPPDNGRNALSFSAGITLPIYRDKYDAATREASETLVAERSNYANIQNEMEFSIRDEAVRFETLREQIRLFEQALIPQSEEALRSTESAYETGQLGVLDLLDSERMLLGVRLVNARYYTDVLVALANLERAVGTRFPR